MTTTNEKDEKLRSLVLLRKDELSQKAFPFVSHNNLIKL